MARRDVLLALALVFAIAVAWGLAHWLHAPEPGGAGPTPKPLR